MSLRLCIECGSSRPRGKASCTECGAAAPAWKAAPLTLKDLLGRVFGALFFAVIGAIIIVTAIILCSEWAFPSWLWRTVQVILAAVIVVFGGLTGLAMEFQAIVTLTERRWTHQETGRVGSARTMLGRIMEAQGHAVRQEGPFMPGVPGVSSVAVFHNMRVFEPRIGTMLGAAMPKAADVAVTVALLGLASRGRCELVVETTRSWEWRSGMRPTRRPERHTILVRRTAMGHALPLEHGFLESAIVTALEAFGASSLVPGPSSLGPYRRGPAEEAPVGIGVPIPIEMLMAALTGRRPKARAWLRAVLREEARRNPAESRLSGEQAGAMAGPLSLLFQRRNHVYPPAAALLFQVSNGISHAGRE